MKIEISQFKSLKYITRFPDDYKKEEKYPLIIFLHGAGSRGNDINVLLNNPFFEITEKHYEFPFVVVAPQCAENTWFDMFETLKQLVVEISCNEFIDKERIYVLGVSMGGYATWQLAMSMPEFFAAIVPICGGGMYWNSGRLLNVPIWAFHGKKDTVVKVEESEKMVDTVNALGGNAKLTIYPENRHDAWSDTYANEDVFKWLLENKNKNIKELKNMYNNAKIYG